MELEWKKMKVGLPSYRFRSLEKEEKRVEWEKGKKWAAIGFD